MKSVAVIGGGVAGIAASVALADSGFRVRLIEKRSLLGGRASSWIDHQTGERLDACQHGTMRCCTNLAALLDRLGVHDLIRYHEVIHFLDREGKRSVIAGSGLPAPLHTSLSFLRFRSLGLRDKTAIARGMMAMLRARPSAAWDEEHIGSWFARHGQTERAVQRFWTPILVSACNESLDRITVGHAFKVFRDGFLGSPQAYHFGVPRVPLGTLYTEPTIAFLQKHGGCVDVHTTVDRVIGSRAGVEAIILQDGERIEADYYVSALQFDLLLKILPSAITDGQPYFENFRNMEFSSIIGVHFWFDRAIECPDALALLDRRSDWIFNKNRNFAGRGSEGDGYYLSVVISADPELTALPKDRIAEIILEEVQEALPETRGARLLKTHVLKERKATFSPKPGIEALRPDQKSPVANLFIAGEWTRTGWPSTMESAAKSGFLAAERVLDAEGRAQRIAMDDLAPEGLSRLLMRR